MLDFFGISIPAFRIAGGIILLLIAIGMINGMHTETRKKVLHLKTGEDTSFEEEFKEAESLLPKRIVPLGIPIYAGPGAISVVVLYSHEALKAGETVCLGCIGISTLDAFYRCRKSCCTSHKTSPW
ncbi:MAG: MarC family protein [Methanospirillaceae archaeon]|nr:MarC family protein [Methanospirillaceae archaeon]